MKDGSQDLQINQSDEEVGEGFPGRGNNMGKGVEQRELALERSWRRWCTAGRRSWREKKEREDRRGRRGGKGVKEKGRE